MTATSAAESSAAAAVNAPALFTPLTIGKLTLANRIIVSPMCQYSALDGSATDWHLIHLGHLALSGAGMLVVEATAVEPAGRITPGCLGLYSDANEQALARALRAVRANSTMPLAIQIGHAGRKASSEVPWNGGGLISPAAGGWQPVAPSAVTIRAEEPAPLALGHAQIEQIVRAFVDTAQRAARLGFDALEVHAAHGYLLHQFLSPIANQRSDDYGGSLANRMRMPLQVIDAVRAVWPVDRPLGVRISATDWVDGGWDLAQSVEFSRQARARGVDWIDVSSGGVSPQQKITLGPGYQVPFAEQIRRELGGPVFAVGLITDAQQAESIIVSGQADAVMLARAMLYDPRWPWHAAAQLGAQAQAPRQYWRSPPREHAQLFGATRFGSR